MSSITLRIAAGVMALGLHAGQASANDVAPGDYTYLPAGTALAMAYIQASHGTTFKTSNGTEVPASEFSSVVGIARGVYYGDLEGHAYAVQAIVPFGQITEAKIGGFPRPVSDGLGDITLGATYFALHSMDPTGTTLGFTTFLKLPTGAFDPNRVSLGSGTFTITPQVGFTQGLGNGFFIDTAADVAFPLDHTSNGVKISRDPTIQAQAYLRYAFSRGTSVAAGYSGTFGGKRTHNGFDTGQRTRVDQLRLVGSAFVSETVQFQGIVSTDFNVEGGFEQDVTGQIRILKLF